MSTKMIAQPTLTLGLEGILSIEFDMSNLNDKNTITEGKFQTFKPINEITWQTNEFMHKRGLRYKIKSTTSLRGFFYTSPSAKESVSDVRVVVTFLQ